MNPSKTIGLGEPDVMGKKALFRPPEKVQEAKSKPMLPPIPKDDDRVRMTLEISKRSLSIIQESQSRYRLDTGHPLPKWRIIDQALELYEKMRKGEGNEK